jgi:glycosyltransferase involved in cell wall biosynthesis
MLMPSVWQESIGRVAAEALLCGIPVIGSNRGSLPEVLGEAAVLLDIPERITDRGSYTRRLRPSNRRR